MAAIATNQTILLSRKLGTHDPNHPRLTENQVQVVLSTQGGATNNLPAQYVGLQTIIGSTGAIKSDNSVVLPTSPSFDGSLLLFSAGTSGVPTDTTGTFNVTVTGVPLGGGQ